jgi:hypothetical protein
MPLVARGDGVDKVDTVHPICTSPGIISTDKCSNDVFVVNVGVHRETDLNEPHTHCPPVFGTPLVTFSSSVYANNLRLGRLGDTYSCSAKIIDVSQNTVFAG